MHQPIKFEVCSPWELKQTHTITALFPLNIERGKYLHKKLIPECKVYTSDWMALILGEAYGTWTIELHDDELLCQSRTISSALTWTTTKINLIIWWMWTCFRDEAIAIWVRGVIKRVICYIYIAILKCQAYVEQLEKELSMNIDACKDSYAINSHQSQYVSQLLGKSHWHTSNEYLSLRLTLTLPGPSTGVSGSLDSYCSLKPLCSGMGEVVPARTSPTLLPPSPRTVLSLSCFKVLQCINCRD